MNSNNFMRISFAITGLEEHSTCKRVFCDFKLPGKKDAEFQLLQEKKNIMDSILDLAFELNAQVEDITTRSGR